MCYVVYMATQKPVYLVRDLVPRFVSFAESSALASAWLWMRDRPEAVEVAHYAKENRVEVLGEDEEVLAVFPKIRPNRKRVRKNV